MPEYRHARITFRDGREVRIILKGEEIPPDVTRLQFLYKAKIRVGRRLSPDEAAVWDELEAQKAVRAREAGPARPLSPDFGRGSGAPV